MYALMPWIAVIVTALAGWALIKRYSTHMVLLFAGLAILLCAVVLGDPNFLPKGVKPSGFVLFDIFNTLKSIATKQSAGIGFLIMEYVPSKSLADLFHSKGAMDPIELLPILIQAARGLFVAHSHGVIHRDVKPANIMVSDTGEVKITDFGVSYSTGQGQITQDGMVVGTAQYISPEQAQGQQATPQSDIYSLGVVAYEGLAGHRPFTGTTPVDIAAAHVNNPVPPLPDSVDVQLREFVMSMLAKDPLDRPKDALVVSRTLARIERRLLDQQTEMADTAMATSGNRLPRRVTSTPRIVLEAPASRLGGNKQ